LRGFGWGFVPPAITGQSGDLNFSFSATNTMKNTNRMDLSDTFLECLMVELILEEDAELDVYLQGTDSETGASSNEDIHRIAFRVRQDCKYTYLPALPLGNA
jgi:hypothetical protein